MDELEGVGPDAVLRILRQLGRGDLADTYQSVILSQFTTPDPRCKWKHVYLPASFCLFTFDDDTCNQLWAANDLLADYYTDWGL